MMSDEKQISMEDRGSKGRYLYRAGGHEAQMTFSRVGASQIIIDHTDVPDAFRGRGIGAALVRCAVEDARRSGVKIRPLCPFARAQFHRHEEWRDVLVER